MNFWQESGYDEFSQINAQCFYGTWKWSQTNYSLSEHTQFISNHYLKRKYSSLEIDVIDYFKSTYIEDFTADFVRIWEKFY